VISEPITPQCSEIAFGLEPTKTDKKCDERLVPQIAKKLEHKKPNSLTRLLMPETVKVAKGILDVLGAIKYKIPIGSYFEMLGTVCKLAHWSWIKGNCLPRFQSVDVVLPSVDS
jgi:hypothetical protein